ncbi:K+/H+ antiporter subunit F [Halomonas sp. EGI 63088]|uniref:K+/H+ antiporter subunit F n=1 Tax=Halomonas flagellata TaxID=2920385 RepID=A0ABS9RRQ9_9GAMM|nr:K+/H+ antiporter subunit F [Halomonas flagellata]MCH4562543.1 K+/H+ antiporter subunit F [Halomonas flagellata]
MIAAVLPLALLLFSVSLLLNLYRLLRGPDLTDRILGLDTLNINAIAVIVLAGIYMDTTIIFEAAMLIALMGFVGTVAMTKYLVRGDVIE